jgi:hypothetical protein
MIDMFKRNADAAWTHRECAWGRGFAMVGLHSCGDLVPTMLQVFAQRDEARAVYAVSCCYMKLKTGMKPQVCLQCARACTSLLLQ